MQKDNTTKMRILDEALKLIKEKGFDSVTINDICKASQVSKHTFYYYFESKDALLIGFHEIPQGLDSSSFNSFVMADNCVDQIWYLIEPCIDFFIELGPEITRRIIIANIMRDIGTFDTSKQKIELIEARVKLVEKAQKSGDIRNNSDPKSLLFVVFVQNMGIISSWGIANGNFNLKDKIREAMEVTLDVPDELRKKSRNP